MCKCNSFGRIWSAGPLAWAIITAYSGGGGDSLSAELRPSRISHGRRDAPGDAKRDAAG